MVNLTIDRCPVTVPEQTTILEAARTVGIRIPTLCYLKGINEVASCRVCAVEIEGVDKLATACNTVVAEGMVVRTSTERVRRTRKINVELILSQHMDHCVTCMRSGNCSLQTLSRDMNVQHVPFGQEAPARPWDPALPILRNSTKCIKCLRCVSVCEKMQTLGVWEVTGSGAHTAVRIHGGAQMDAANCSLCGQCVVHCPVGALQERDDTERVFEAMADPSRTVVFQIAPAVRAAWGDGLGLSPELATEKRLAASVRAMGVEHVFDTSFSADLTIMEESGELIERLAGRKPGPLFTSCCPGWVRFVKQEAPELLPQVSTAKSPQQMFGAVTKSYYAKLLGKDPKELFCVSVMPCTAKKYECSAAQPADAPVRDVDVALTTRELDRMLRAMQVSPASLPEEEFDSPMGSRSGAGVIFGATGGVMEAALRTAYWRLQGKDPSPDAFQDLRGPDGWREAEFTIGDRTLHVAVASGLGNARELLRALREGRVQYDFVEVMACPGGCVGGGGQPIREGVDVSLSRGSLLFALDEADTIRFSHENPDVRKLYEDYLDAPLSEKAHELLHTDQAKWPL